MLRPTLIALAGVLALSACAEQGGVQQDTTADPPDAGGPTNPLTGDPLPPLDTSLDAGPDTIARRRSS